MAERGAFFAQVDTISVKDSARGIIPMLLKLCNEDEELLNRLVLEIYRQVLFNGIQPKFNPTKKNGR